MLAGADSNLAQAAPQPEVMLNWIISLLVLLAIHKTCVQVVRPALSVLHGVWGRGASNSLVPSGGPSLHIAVGDAWLLP